MSEQPFAYSRGRNIHDAQPRRRGVTDFAAFVAALDGDRAARKDGAAFVCGPLNGTGHRCAEGAEPRRWLALDFDRIAADTLPELRLWFASRSGCAWPTHSSTPAEPRERVILELDRDATRDECLQVGAVVARDLAAEFGDAIALDGSTFRGEQPVFVPPVGVVLARFTGEPLCVDTYLAEPLAPAPPAGAPAEAANSPADPAKAREVREALYMLDVDDREVWLHAGMALHSTGWGRPAYALWTAWAQQSDKFSAPDQRRVWDSFGKPGGHAPRSITLGTIFAAAQAAGWANPRRGERQPVHPAPADANDAARPLDIFREIVAPPLDAADFPPVLADFAAPLARAAGHDAGAYLMAGLCAAAGATDDGLRVLLDSTTGWFESPRLWGLLIGLPGTAKTPAMRAAMGPLYELHAALAKDYERECAALAADAPRPPRRALFANDATLEKLSEVLRDNPRGILCGYEELDSWIGSHDAYRGGQGSKDRGDWLRLYDGGPHQVDRVMRGSYFVENWGVSLLGATTPAGLRRHAKNLPPDGLMQRFLPVHVRAMVAPDTSIHAPAVRAASEAFAQRVRELYAAPGGIVRLSCDAAGVFRRRREALREAVPAASGLSEPFAAHLAKHAGMLGRLALTMHALEHGAGAKDTAVSGETMQRAERLLRVLMRHALVLYDMLGYGDGALPLARAVARSIVADHIEVVTRGELRQACRAFKDESDFVREQALHLLIDAAWLTPVAEARQYAGRVTQFAVAPEVFGLFAHRGAELRQRRRQIRELLA